MGWFLMRRDPSEIASSLSAAAAANWYCWSTSGEYDFLPWKKNGGACKFYMFLYESGILFILDKL